MLCWVAPGLCFKIHGPSLVFGCHQLSMSTIAVGLLCIQKRIFCFLLQDLGNHVPSSHQERKMSGQLSDWFKTSHRHTQTSFFHHFLPIVLRSANRLATRKRNALRCCACFGDIYMFEVLHRNSAHPIVHLFLVPNLFKTDYLLDPIASFTHNVASSLEQCLDYQVKKNKVISTRSSGQSREDYR